MSYTTTSGGIHELVIAPTKGAFNDQVQGRSYAVRIHAQDKPRSISIGGKQTSQWAWDDKEGIATITMPKQSIRDSVDLMWQ